MRKELELVQQVHLRLIHSFKNALCLLNRLVSSSDHGDRTVWVWYEKIGQGQPSLYARLIGFGFAWLGFFKQGQFSLTLLHQLYSAVGH